MSPENQHSQPEIPPTIEAEHQMPLHNPGVDVVAHANPIPEGAFAPEQQETGRFRQFLGARWQNVKDFYSHAKETVKNAATREGAVDLNKAEMGLALAYEVVTAAPLRLLGNIAILGVTVPSPENESTPLQAFVKAEERVRAWEAGITNPVLRRKIQKGKLGGSKGPNSHLADHGFVMTPDKNIYNNQRPDGKAGPIGIWDARRGRAGAPYGYQHIPPTGKPKYHKRTSVSEHLEAA